MYRVSLILLGALTALLASVVGTTAQEAPRPPIAPNQARPDQAITGLDGPGFALAYSEATGVLAAACERSAIRYWSRSVSHGVRVGDATPNLLQGHQGPVTALAWGGGTVLASAGADQKVLLWNMPDGRLLHTLAAGCVVRALAMSPDGKLLAGGGDDAAIQLWDVASGNPGARLSGNTDWVLCLTFSPDGKLLASGGHDGIIRLWEAASGKKLRDIPGKPPPPAKAPPAPAYGILALAFSPDGKQLAVGGMDAQIHLVNTADGKPVRSITGHGSSVTALTFHPSGSVLVSASKDRTVRLWNPANGQLIKALEGHTAWVQDVKLLANGTRLASLGADQTVRFWDLTAPSK